MRHDELLAYALAKPGAWQDEPWEGDVVAKVGDKIFAFLGRPGPDGAATGITLKCGRTKDEAAHWRERYPDHVAVSAYIGRYGWNAFTLDGTIPGDEILEALDDSYDDVVSRLPKSKLPNPGRPQ